VFGRTYTFHICIKHNGDDAFEDEFKFYAYHSVHRESILKKFQQDDTVQYFIISCQSLYMFRAYPMPIIRSSI
jgi:hypothetical protein